MRFFFFVVTLFVISFQSDEANAMDIECEFYTRDLGYGVKNGCDVLSVTLSSSEDREITSVNGDSGKIYNDVWWFLSLSKTFNNFPQNIKKIFPNVDSVFIHHANITTLTKSDVASLGSQLRRFYSTYSKIEVLEEGLFDGNPNLDNINLSMNNIKFVVSGVFDKLPKLRTLWFYNNTCHSGNAWDDRAKVLTLIKQIEENCQDPQTITTTEQELGVEEVTQP